MSSTTKSVGGAKTITEVLQVFERDDKRSIEDDTGSDSCSHSGSCDDVFSTCSSYTDSDNDDGCVEWESEVKNNGQLYFILSHPSKQLTLSSDSSTPVCNTSDLASSLNNPTNPKKSGGKFVRLIRRRESKRHRNSNINHKEESFPRHEAQLSTIPSVSTSSPPPTERSLLYNVDLQVDPWVIQNLGRRATFSEILLGLVTSSPESGLDVFVLDHVPDGLAARHSNIKIGDKVVSVNGMVVTTQNFNSVLEAIKAPLTLHLVMCSATTSADVNHQDLYLQSKSPKVLHQSRLAEIISGQKSFSSEVQSALGVIPVAVLYLQLDGLTEGGSEDQGILYCYPGNIKSNTLCAIRGAFLTLQQLIPDITNSSPVSSSLVIHDQLTHVAYVEENRELLLLALPHNSCSLPETIKICSELVKVLQFKHQSLSRCFNSSINHEDLDHFMSIFLTCILKSEKWLEVVGKQNNLMAPSFGNEYPQFESLLPAALLTPLPQEVQVQLDEALSELESNDLGDMCDNHDCQRLFNILGSCIYHKGCLLASHFVVDDLLDVHAFCRRKGLLHLNQTEAVRSLIIWQEVFPSSVFRGLQVCPPSNNESTSYKIPEGRWFILIVGQKHDMLVLLLEAGGCSSRAEGIVDPDAIYVEAAQDTLRHLQKTGVTSIASSWLEANIRPQVTCPEALVGSKTSPRLVNNLLGLRLPSDSTSSSVGRQTGFRTNISSSSIRKSSDSLLHTKGRPSPDNSGSGPLHGETSEDSASLVASLPSDDTGPFLSKRRQVDQEFGTTHSDNDQSDGSDSDWESFHNQSSHRLASTTDLSNTHRSLVKKIEEAIPSKISYGVENSVFHYVHVDASEGVLLCPVLPPSSHVCGLKEILIKFRSCAMRIHTLLQNSISFKKLKGVEVNQSHINKSLVAIKEFGALFEYHLPSRGNEKAPRSLNYWVVGRLFFTPLPREVYVCYHDTAPQNMVELAFRLSLTSIG